MILNLTDISSEPLQSQIVRQVRAKILAGELPAETSLPSIRQLARDHHVSVITVQRAYESLLRDNLIHSRRGKGFFVSHLPDHEKRDKARQRLAETLEKPISDAVDEGMSVDDIREIVEKIIKKLDIE
ncbi:GntR family transcriptional regulator [candidate division KSB1 bacterium]|nr:GntR family transcriptional regulator [candidate division KSB1 bacterium]